MVTISGCKNPRLVKLKYDSSFLDIVLLYLSLLALSRNMSRNVQATATRAPTIPRFFRCRNSN